MEKEERLQMNTEDAERYRNREDLKRKAAKLKANKRRCLVRYLELSQYLEYTREIIHFYEARKLEDVSDVINSQAKRVKVN